MTLPVIKIEINIHSKCYVNGTSETEVLRDVHLSLSSVSRWGVMGPSGVGKTSLFRIIAGLDRSFDGERHLSADGVTIEPSIGFVFQDRRILPWLSVEQNVAMPLLADPTGSVSMAAATRDDRVQQLLATLNLCDRKQAYPWQISGGQMARVAIARALVHEPNILILDEPLSGLDRPARQELFEYLERLHDNLGFLQIVVSHQADEIIALSDRVILLSGSPAGVCETMEVGLGGNKQWLAPTYYERVRDLEKLTSLPP